MAQRKRDKPARESSADVKGRGTRVSQSEVPRHALREAVTVTDDLSPSPVTLPATRPPSDSPGATMVAATQTEERAAASPPDTRRATSRAMPNSPQQPNRLTAVCLPPQV